MRATASVATVLALVSMGLVAGPSLGCRPDSVVLTKEQAARALEGRWRYLEPDEETVATIERSAPSEEERAVALSQAKQLAGTELAFADGTLTTKQGDREIKESFRVTSVTLSEVVIEREGGARDVLRLDGDAMEIVDGPIAYRLERVQ